MHFLNTILVKLTNKLSNEEYINYARNIAEEETEQFIYDVFDWRETETAGRWADEYPVNVILGKTEPERFIEELEKCLNYRDNKIKQYLSYLKAENNSLDIETISENIIKNEDIDRNYMSDIRLIRLATLLYGEYTYESIFFDTTELNSKISRAKIEKIKNELDKYALVFFDHHI